MRGARLDDEEDGQEQQAKAHEQERLRPVPAVLRRPRDAVDEGDQAQGRGDRARHVVAGVARGLRLADEGDRHEDREDRDGHVHEHRPVPGGVLGEDAAEHEADGGAAARERTVDAEGLRPLLAVGERHRDEGEGRGREDRREEALQSAGREQHGRVHRDAGEGAREGEAGEADDEHPLAPGVVGDATAQEQQAAEGERVGRDDPLPVGVADAEVLLDRRQCDVHDRAVQHHHELRDGDDEERLPAPRIGLGGEGHRGRSGG